MIMGQNWRYPPKMTHDHEAATRASIEYLGKSDNIPDRMPRPVGRDCGGPRC
jgi:hypothetical protein